jgi:hypothetical protein
MASCTQLPESGVILNLRNLFDITTAADRFLFLILFMLSISGIFFVRELLPESRSVLIDVNGKTAYVFPLQENRTIAVEGPQGRTIVEIKGNRVRIIDSPCPHKLCVKQGWIQKGSLVCLPNSVVITIQGPESDDRGIDAVTR